MDPPSGSSPSSTGEELDESSPTTKNLHTGVTSLQGKREYMEDRFTSINNVGEIIDSSCCNFKHVPALNSNPLGYHAIFDGHGGNRAATYCSENLHKQIINHKLLFTDLHNALKESFLATDDEFLDLAQKNNMYDGSTAIVAIVYNSILVVANLGDCCAVLCRDGKPLLMNDIHSPLKEVDRIEKAGGWVTVEKELYMAKLQQMDLTDSFVRDHVNRSVRWVTTSRINGELAVSRAIGDSDYKGTGMLKYTWSVPPSSSGEKCRDMPLKFTSNLIIAEPTIKEEVLTDADDFFLLACDGLWDVLSYLEVVEFVKICIGNKCTGQETTDALSSLAMRLGSADNITVILVTKPESGW
jgi:serine/threonine protein phosphatase PrpC